MSAPPVLPTSAGQQAPAPRPSGTLLIDALLHQQADLTAIERVATELETTERPAQAKYYQSLIPAAPPGPGQQYAFEVDLDRCSGCKACVTACHELNGLDGGETWRDVGLLMGGTSSLPVLQHVTSACHHCLEPGCLTACPVNAYEKDPLTGIVKHLDDQCFGCQYCTLACPYDVPKYHNKLGIVRKCDMCSTRLGAGEAPACVQACPHEAIRIQVVDVQQVADDAEAAMFLPGAPDPEITLPTTSYRTKRSFPRNMLPADYYDVRPQHAHPPLVVMLVLTQLSVGAYLAGWVLQLLLPEVMWKLMQPVHATGALLTGLLALGASTLHLGRPHLAWRGALGILHSWLSREIVAFGAFAGLGVLYFTLVHLEGRLPAQRQALALEQWSPTLAVGVALAGVVGVFCSVMIYVVTQRELWSFGRTSLRFFGTTALLGVAAVWLSLLVLAMSDPQPPVQRLLVDAGGICAKLLLAIAAAKLLWEASQFRHLASRRMTSQKRSALLMSRQLSSITLARFAAGLLGGVVMPAFVLQRLASAETSQPLALTPLLIAVAVLVLFSLIGELLERYLFFAALAAPRMPGPLK
ncbi:MAG: DmsC/YnfH family molybdoenzyme membrane anchor subunit [Pirellulaceae bacterium]